MSRPLSEDERLDRNLRELLEEIRVAMPGVQVLFAFLLAVPFQARFVETSTGERWLYAVALAGSALATVSFLTPTAYHRLMFHRRDRRRLVALANRCALIGLACLGAATVSAVTLISSFLTGPDVVPIAVCCATTLLTAGVWFGLGFSRRRSRPPGD